MRATLATSPLPPGYKLLWFEIRSVLGEGGFGITYAAQDDTLNQQVAIKEHFPRESCMRDTLLQVAPRGEQLRGRYHWGLERFVGEARTLARFRHPNIVHVRTAFEHNGTAYMVMDLEQGQTLAGTLRAAARIDEADILRLSGPLLHGLAQVHAAGFIHRDIKPDNIIMRADNRPVLVDFGSSRFAAQPEQQALTAVVTRGYAPFEQYADGEEQQGPWGDIYSFAAVLYALVTGQVPADALRRSAGLLGTGEDPLVSAQTAARGRYSAELLAAIDHGLTFAARDRPRSVEDWVQRFPSALRIEASVATAMSAPAPPASADPFSEAATAQADASPRTVPPDTPTDLSTVQALVVDDEPYVRALAQRVLERVGVTRTRLAGNGREALASLADTPQTDVVLLDLRMADMDGIEFLRELSRTAHRPAIILVSSVDSLLRHAAETFARSNGFAVLGSADKPLAQDALRTMLARYVTTTNMPRPAGQARIELAEEELLAGLHNGALVPHYQPKVTSTGRVVIGVETLARWQRASGELLGPAAFIPLAERTGHIHALTLSLLQRALTDCGEWHARGVHVDLALNVSAASFTDLVFPDRLEATANAQGVPTAGITLEVTERMVADDMVAMMDILMRLRIKGITLSIDDFGTGYASLQQLHRLPFTELKIDRAFVSGTAHDRRAHSILEASVSLARKLGMTTIAEGVETESDWRAVQAVGCELVQGFLIAQPMACDDLLAWLSTHGHPGA